MSRMSRRRYIHLTVLLVFLLSTLAYNFCDFTKAAETETNSPQSTQRVEKYVYKQTPQGELAMYVHFPKDWTENDKWAAIVFFFGGAWRTGNVEQFVPQAEYLADRGMVTARADYRVEDRHGTTPDKCVEDGKSAVRWLRANAAKLGIDPNRIVASGHSCGGHIAACTSTIKGLDFQGEDLSVSSKPNLLVLFEAAALRYVPGMIRSLEPEMAVKISPYHTLSKEVPPAFLYYGTDDSGLVAGIEFIEKSKKLGGIAELYIAEGQRHWSFKKSPWRERTIYLADKFLARYGYTQGEPTVRLPEGKVEIENMSDIDLNAYAENRLGHTPLHRAARHGDKELVEFLIAQGANVNAKDCLGCTALGFAGLKDVAEILLAKGADVNAKNKGGYTLLHLAARSGSKERAKFLISHGADVNATNSSGLTPLLLAYERGDKEVTELLIDEGANIEVRDTWGRTPLHIAAKNGQKDYVELFIAKRADVNAPNNKGRTPLWYAQNEGHTEIAELLRKHGAKE